MPFESIAVNKQRLCIYPGLCQPCASGANAAGLIKRHCAGYDPFTGTVPRRPCPRDRAQEAVSKGPCPHVHPAGHCRNTGPFDDLIPSMCLYYMLYNISYLRSTLSCKTKHMHTEAHALRYILGPNPARQLEWGQNGEAMTVAISEERGHGPESSAHCTWERCTGSHVCRGGCLVLLSPARPS